MEALLQHDMHWHGDDQNPIHYNITLCLAILFLALRAVLSLRAFTFFFHPDYPNVFFSEFRQPLQLPFPFRTAGSRLFLCSLFHSRMVPVFPPFTVSYVTLEQKYQQQKGLPSHKHSEANVIAASGRITAICTIVCHYGENSAVFLFLFLLLDKLRASQVCSVPAPALYKLVLEPKLPLIAHFSASLFRRASFRGAPIITNVLFPCDLRNASCIFREACVGKAASVHGKHLKRSLEANAQL